MIEAQFSPKQQIEIEAAGTPALFLRPFTPKAAFESMQPLQQLQGQWFGGHNRHALHQKHRIDIVRLLDRADRLGHQELRPAKAKVLGGPAPQQLLVL